MEFFFFIWALLKWRCIFLSAIVQSYTTTHLQWAVFQHRRTTTTIKMWPGPARPGLKKRKEQLYRFLSRTVVMVAVAVALHATVLCETDISSWISLVGSYPPRSALLCECVSSSSLNFVKMACLRFSSVFWGFSASLMSPQSKRINKSHLFPVGPIPSCSCLSLLLRLLFFLISFYSFSSFVLAFNRESKHQPQSLLSFYLPLADRSNPCTDILYKYIFENYTGNRRRTIRSRHNNNARINYSSSPMVRDCWKGKRRIWNLLCLLYKRNKNNNAAKDRVGCVCSPRVPWAILQWRSKG